MDTEKKGYVELMGTTEKGGQRDSFEKEERRNRKWTAKNDR